MAIIVRSRERLQVEVIAGAHTFVADEPAGIGDDAGLTPYDLLLASLGTCTVMTLLMYARRKHWPLDGVEARLSTRKVHASDVETCEADDDSRVDLIERELVLLGPLEDEQRQRLIEIADKCPVHRTLRGEIVIQTTMGQADKETRDAGG
jgi:putative redox protein